MPRRPAPSQTPHLTSRPHPRQVTDETADPVNPPYAYSDVVRAVDYGVAKGARIFSMSFGDQGRTSKQVRPGGGGALRSLSLCAPAARLLCGCVRVSFRWPFVCVPSRTQTRPSPVAG